MNLLLTKLKITNYLQPKLEENLQLVLSILG